MNWKQNRGIDEMKAPYILPMIEFTEISETDVIRTSLEMPPMPIDE